MGNQVPYRSHDEEPVNKTYLAYFILFHFTFHTHVRSGCMVHISRKIWFDFITFHPQKSHIVSVLLSFSGKL